jgi:gamma-butyrobetaine dioxygenase
MSLSHSERFNADIGQISFDSRFVRIYKDDKPILELPHLWLRDNCPCDECRVLVTQEKSFILSSVPPDICPDKVELIGEVLSIDWPGGHQSSFNLNDILTLSQPRHSASKPWASGFLPAYFDWGRFIIDDSYTCTALESFLINGVIVIDKAPIKPDSLELLADRLGPIREVLFERIHNVSVDTHVYNVAHTPMALPPHNDFASYSFPPSAQALHMLVNEAEGGNSIIVDAWAIASQIREEMPNHFAILCDFMVPFREFDECNETYAVAPIIKCDAKGKIESVRFSNQLMQMMDPNQKGIEQFYLAYHDLCTRITDSRNKCSFRLKGGQVLLVAAHRVLHARESFVPRGKRHLQDAYFELDNIANKLVLLKANLS